MKKLRYVVLVIVIITLPEGVEQIEKFLLPMVKELF